MSRAPVFAIAANKIERARGELDRLDVYLAEHDRSGMRNVWSRTSTIAFAVHNIYNGIEDVMSDMAREIDDHLPTGVTSHQALLDQMWIDLEGRRPALLDAGTSPRALGAESLSAPRAPLRHRPGSGEGRGRADPRGFRSDELLSGDGQARAGAHRPMRFGARDFTFLHLAPLRPKHTARRVPSSQPDGVRA